MGEGDLTSCLKFFLLALRYVLHQNFLLEKYHYNASHLRVSKSHPGKNSGDMALILIVVASPFVFRSPSSAFCIHVGGAFAVMGATLVSVFDMLITYVFRYDTLHLSHITVLPAAHHGEMCKVSSSVGCENLLPVL